MKILTLCLMLLAVCVPAMTQIHIDETHLDPGSGGILIVYNDINTDPERLPWVRSLIENDNTNVFGTIVIMSTANTIPQEAFMRSNAEYINFQPTSRITVIPEGVFMDNHRLRLVHLPPSVTTIESDAFGNCTNLTVVRFGSKDEPSRLETIADLAFWGTNISRMYVPDSVRNIGYEILYPGTNIQSIRLPANVNIDSENPFHSIYIQNGRRAGVYVRGTQGRWRYTNDVETEEEFLSDGWSFLQ